MMFASAILMSPIDDGFITTVHLESALPIFRFGISGSLDTNPLPNKTKDTLNNFRARALLCDM